MQAYAREIDEHKRTLLLINKADLLPNPVRLVVTPVFLKTEYFVKGRDSIIKTNIIFKTLIYIQIFLFNYHIFISINVC